jgi:TfoX/Sxy family transcriptional regulator of competence genes
MEHDPKRLQAIVETAAPPDLELRFRPMFGGILAYADGAPFASLSNVGLALKFAGGAHAELLAIEGAHPLRYAADQPMSKTYIVVPEAMLGNADALRSWIARSLAEPKPAAKRAPRKSKA